MSPWRPLPNAGDAEPHRLGDSLDSLARRVGAPEASVAGRLFAQWDAAVGADIARHARPVSLVDKVLVVAVDDPAWASQLRWLADDLSGRLCDVVGPGTVVKIDVRIAPPPSPLW